jgi:hypothetical protein
LRPIDLGFWSYAAACLGHLLLAAWIFIGNRGGRPGRLISSGCLLTALWAATASLASTKSTLNPVVLAIAEPMHTIIWIAVLLYLPARSEADHSAESTWGRMRSKAWILLSVLLTVSLAADFLLLGERVSFASKIALSVFGLVCVEQLFRNTPNEQRWSIKLLCVALIALFSFDVVMYSDALLFGRLKYPWWIARGFAAAAIIVLIFVSVNRVKTWGIGLAVSRSVAFTPLPCWCLGPISSSFRWALIGLDKLVAAGAKCYKPWWLF